MDTPRMALECVASACDALSAEMKITIDRLAGERAQAREKARPVPLDEEKEDEPRVDCPDDLFSSATGSEALLRADSAARRLELLMPEGGEHPTPHPRAPSRALPEGALSAASLREETIALQARLLARAKLEELGISEVDAEALMAGEEERKEESKEEVKSSEHPGWRSAVSRG